MIVHDRESYEKMRDNILGVFKYLERIWLKITRY